MVDKKEQLRALITKALHESTPEEEADACAVAIIRTARREKIGLSVTGDRRTIPVEAYAYYGDLRTDDVVSVIDELFRRATAEAQRHNQRTRPRPTQAEPVKTVGYVFKFECEVRLIGGTCDRMYLDFMLDSKLVMDLHVPLSQVVAAPTGGGEKGILVTTARWAYANLRNPGDHGTFMRKEDYEAGK